MSKATPPIFGSHYSAIKAEIEEMLQNRFSVRFKHLMREKNLSNPYVYRKANIGRKLFSKIVSNENSVPGKTTVLALAVALELDAKKTQDMLQWAGYSFSSGILSDIIVSFFIENGISH